jgi:hypothetical protein
MALLQNINQQQIRQNNCTRHSEWLKLPFSCGNRSCSIQDLSETRSLQNNETARQKSVHDYVVNTPFYFEGNMSAEFLRDLVCSCKGKSQCKKSCVCAEQNLAWTDLCSCHGSESCKNVHSYTGTCPIGNINSYKTYLYAG